MTFNHGVEGSSPSALTKQNQALRAFQGIWQKALCGHCVGKTIAASPRDGLRKQDRALWESGIRRDGAIRPFRSLYCSSRSVKEQKAGAQTPAFEAH